MDDGEVTIARSEMIVLPRWNIALHVAVERDRKIQWFPLRSICGALGVSWSSQSEVIKQQARFREATRMISLKTEAGTRQMLCMKRPELSFWIAGIDPRRVKGELRDDLEAFQRELMNAADKLLWPGTHVLPAGQRGVIYHADRTEITFACEDCGAFHRIIIENGEVTVTRQ